MKKNSINKYIIIITIAIILIAFLAPHILAANYNIDVNSAKPNTTPGSDPLLEQRINMVLGYIQTIGSIISVIVLTIIGIKYIIGSVEEKAEYKKTLIPYFIGAVLLFAGANIVQIIYDWAIVLNN